MYALPVAFIVLGIGLLAAFFLLRRNDQAARHDMVFGMVKSLPLLKSGSDFSVAATVRSKTEYKILIEHKSCQTVKGGILANLAVLDERGSRLVGALPARLIDLSGKCSIPAYHEISRVDITFSIAQGPGDVTHQPADYLCLVLDKPNGNPFADIAEAILKDSYLQSKDGVASARRELVKAIHPDWGAPEDDYLRGEALAWASSQLSAQRKPTFHT